MDSLHLLMQMSCLIVAAFLVGMIWQKAGQTSKKPLARLKAFANSFVE